MLNAIKHKCSLALLIIIFIFICCKTTFTNNESILGYNFGKPDKTTVLPDTLHEISGITNIDSTTFACIQDENGIIFFYDVKKNYIKRQLKFNIDGDYEGITRVGNNMYILRSDGTLFEILNFNSNNFSLNSYSTGIPANNNEGLCYDEANKRLLIACKSKVGNGHDFKDKRAIFGFDLKTKRLTSIPVFDFDLQKIKDFATKNNIKITSKKHKKKAKHKTEPDIKFKPSAICIHPLSNNLYLLSATDYLLFIFDMKGNIQHIEKLNPALFNKAEGITFYENGDLLITNEGQNKKPTVLLFKYRK
ncbi:MAG: hypothetical protein HUU47_04540 [Bacteroidetes bacterium]|nr:hypothetical protein [Bacteroidota bacterium]